MTGLGLNDYEEENLRTLVLGNCELRLNGIRETLLEKETSAGKSKIAIPENFPEGFEEILENVSNNDNEISLNGFMTINGDYLWVNWKIKFEKFEFLWDTHVTVDEWKHGNLPR